MAGSRAACDLLLLAALEESKALAVPECQSVRIGIVTLDGKCQEILIWTLF